MPNRRSSVAMKHPIIVTFLIMAIVASMALAADVLKPLALAVLLSFALEPFARFLQQRLRLPRVAAVVLTVVTAVGALGGVGYVVGQQLTSLAGRLPAYEQNVVAKIERLRPGHETVLAKASKVASDVAETLDEATREPNVVDVRVVSRASLGEQLAMAIGPYLELMGVGLLVLVLVLFLLLDREELRDRIVQLFGRGRITLTTRTMDEAGQRISRYLAMLATVNSAYGVLVGLGLWSIGLPYAVLWGFLAGALRFIPYAGPAVAFLLPMLFSVAYFPAAQWQGPAEVLVLFLVLELLANFAVEPVIYGRTTGVWALGLLVAAMFWTWLWGLPGLLLATPMTVCLAVLGKYVPSLGFFATLLGEEAELAPDLRYYQRLLALDQEGAAEVVETELAQQPRIALFDQIMLPALSRSQRDFARDALDERERAFIAQVTQQLVAQLEATDDPQHATANEPPGADGKVVAEEGRAGGQASAPAASAANGRGDPAAAVPALRVVGVGACCLSDALALRMLAMVMRPAGLALDLLDDSATPLQVADRVAELEADVVVVSHVPPGGLAATRYLVRRLRARFPHTPIVVGRWSKAGNPGASGERLSNAGATQVVLSLGEARELLLGLARPKTASPPSLIPDLEVAASPADG